LQRETGGEVGTVRRAGRYFAYSKIIYRSANGAIAPYLMRSAIAPCLIRQTELFTLK
jgi:hypothetical protein